MPDKCPGVRGSRVFSKFNLRFFEKKQILLSKNTMKNVKKRGFGGHFGHCDWCRVETDLLSENVVTISFWDAAELQK